MATTTESRAAAAKILADFETGRARMETLVAFMAETGNDYTVYVTATCMALTGIGRTYRLAGLTHPGVVTGDEGARAAARWNRSHGGNPGTALSPMKLSAALARAIASTDECIAMVRAHM